LAAGATRRQVAEQVVASSEYQRHLAGVDLSTFLGRRPDAVSVDYFASELRSGVRDESVIGQILSSDEFFAKATGG
jgi:hypothetical protein